MYLHYSCGHVDFTYLVYFPNRCWMITLALVLYCPFSGSREALEARASHVAQAYKQITQENCNVNLSRNLWPHNFLNSCTATKNVKQYYELRIDLYQLKEKLVASGYTAHFFIITLHFPPISVLSTHLCDCREEGRKLNFYNFIISFQFWLWQIVFYCLGLFTCFCFLFIIYICVCLSVRLHRSICTTCMQEPEERKRGCGIPVTWLTGSCESSIFCEGLQSSLRDKSTPNHWAISPAPYFPLK